MKNLKTNKMKSILTAIIFVGFSTMVLAQTKQEKKAGVIKIKDKKAIIAGNDRKDKDVFKISLEDLQKYSGHSCGCDVAGFLITREVLSQLFPNEIPSRRMVKVSISEYNMDLIDAISFITGTRLNRGEYTNSESDFIVDKSIAGEVGTTVIIFERKDNGKKIKVIIDRMKLLTPKELKTVSEIKKKIKKGVATDEEKAKFAKITKDIIIKELTNLPEGAITYEKIN